jgi:uncharacterized protein
MGHRGRRGIDAEAARHILIPTGGRIGMRGRSRRIAPCHISRSSAPIPLFTRIVGSIPREAAMTPRFALITVLTTLAAASPASAVERSIDSGSDHWIEVTGEGSVNAAPDFARVTLGVTNTAKTAGEALADNTKAASALVSLIKAQGVAPADIQTSNLSISPMFSQPPRGQEIAPTITGYNVNNNVALKVHDIPRLGELLDKAVTADANSVYGIGFDHTDPSGLLDNARAVAVADARRKANIYANAAGQDRTAHDADRRARPNADRPLSSPHLYVRRRRSDANRGGRRQVDRDRDGAV